jgi:hypothetical protein
MISLQKYKAWFSGKKEIDEQSAEAEIIGVFDAIDRSHFSAYQKDALASYYLDSIPQADHVKRLKLEKMKDAPEQMLSSWMAHNAYQKHLQQVQQDDHTKFMMSGLTVIMSGTLCIYFVYAVCSQKFLLNFSLDALIGSIAFAFLIINIRKKLQIAKRYSSGRELILLEGISFLICALLKMVIPSMFDLSVVILFIAYMTEKKKLEKMIAVSIH